MRFAIPAAFVIAGSLSAADEAVVAADNMDVFKNVPKEVQQGISKAANGAQIQDIDREEENGQNFYDAELKQGDKEWQIRVGQDGTLVKDYKHTNGLDKAPAAVKTALLKAAGDDQIVDVDRESDDGRTWYEAKIKGAKDDRTIAVDEAGKTIEKKQ
ncbi:MAG TPA: hypothetical protein VEL07_04250 [Planctomycetota bacterium]|nr:hypothetical protein [Planctomycetota bacterium]